MTARGVGSQSYVEFISLAGTFQALKAQAGSDDLLSNTENFATQITNVSTAVAVLLREANGGQPINSQALIDTLSPLLNGEQVLQLATAIKLLVDAADNYPMPSGQTSLQALLANTTAREQLVAEFYAQDSTTFNNTQNAIVSDATLTQPITGATLPSTLTAALLTDDDVATYADPDRVISYTFNADGTGTASAGQWHRNMTWSIAGASVEVTYEHAIVDMRGWELAICPELSNYYAVAGYPIVYNVDGAKLTLLSKNLLTVTETRHITHRDCGPGPDTEIVTVARTILDADDFQVLDIAELRNSTRALWVYDSDYDVAVPNIVLIPDLAELRADGTGTTLTYGKQFDWSLDSSGRILNVTFNDGVTATFRSIRDLDNVATDVLYDFTLPTGRRVDAGASLRADPQVAFTTDNVLGRHYRFGIDEQPVAPGGKGSRYRFDADGVGSRERENVEQDGSIRVEDSASYNRLGYRWNIEGNDLVLQYTTSTGFDFNCHPLEPLCQLFKDARMIPLAREGTRTYWFEAWRNGRTDVRQAFQRDNLIVYYEYEPFGTPATVTRKPAAGRTKSAPVRLDSHILRGADHKLRN
ncbi:hypothetical protein [Steroidobacter cummioxidans]|uniref:hypothetical protein n=1 Tax=Steroidobacter cummioxidans TaxID=1803913 RepID=UPI000E31A738|nr:hypothetical protein [Steroidobacter cummioxidans]